MANIGKYVEEINHFFKEVAAELHTPKDLDHAGRVTVAVLHTLRDRISTEESMHFISGLPMILKGLYVDGWKISKNKFRTDSLKEFLDDVRKQPPAFPGRDFGNDQNTGDHIRAVLKVIRKYVPEGEFRDIRVQLPEEMSVLFES